MISLFLIATLVASTFAQYTINPNQCGKRPSVNDLVTGGTVAANGAWPWQVSLRYGTGATKSHLCGGSVINQRWIVTAAHCVSGRLTAANWAIDMGGNNRNSLNTWIISGAAVNYVVAHPSYSSATFRNDIALMRLTNPIPDGEWSKNEINAVCLRTATNDIAGGISYASGWGTTSSGGATLPANLMQVDLALTTFAACNSYYGTSYDSATMICAGTVGDGKDTCQGDSGGPLVYKDTVANRWELVGITSWGYGCGDIGVYARVSTYIAWINGVLAAN